MTEPVSGTFPLLDKTQFANRSSPLKGVAELTTLGLIFNTEIVGAGAFSLVNS
jgi:hypothetical protein